MADLRICLDDASCVVRFSLRPEELGRTDFFIVRETAYAVLHECVKSRKQGGVAVGFSRSESTHLTTTD